MNIYCKTRKSHRWNEDRFIKGKNYCIVIDGATPLIKSGLFNEARWLADYFKNNVSKYGGTIKNRLLTLCGNAYRDFPAEIKNADYLPSAGACWAEWDENYVYIGILGDCEITALTNDGKIIRYFDGRLRQLDEIAIEKMVSAAKEHGTTVLQARKFINDILIKHRKRANKPDGYPALTISPDSNFHESAFRLIKEDIKTLYLYSDGFSQAFENLKIYPEHTDMFRQIKNIDEEIEKIVTRSFSDPNCDKYPRFKKIDDITVVKIDF